MSAERPHSYNLIEQEHLFSKWAKNNGIQRFLFDLDDTICASGDVFRDHKSQVVNCLFSQNQNLLIDQIEKRLEEIDNISFEKYGVNKNRWNIITDQLSDEFQINPENRQKIKDIFQHIFETPPLIFEDAEKILCFIKNAGIPIGIVTHGGKEATKNKYNWLNLKRFSIKWEDVYCIDENGHKTHESWQEAINYFGIKPENCAVVGDSPRSDINPARKIGVKHCFLKQNPKPWLVQQEVIDSEVIIIKKLDEIIKIASK